MDCQDATEKRDRREKGDTQVAEELREIRLSAFLEPLGLLVQREKRVTLESLELLVTLDSTGRRVTLEGVRLALPVSRGIREIAGLMEDPDFLGLEGHLEREVTWESLVWMDFLDRLVFLDLL